MKFSACAIFLGLAAAVNARVPLIRRQDANTTSADGGPTDVQILNFALTLEYLENAFYQGGLQKYSDADFTNAGYSPYTRGRFEQIAAHEATHVAFLQKALGGQATNPCTYNFPYKTLQEFVALAASLESVGGSAYSGASKFIENKDYLLAAATVLATEARHAGWIESAVRKGAPWGSAYETPLDLNQVYTLASAMIKSCPSTNPQLPVKAYPALKIDGSVVAGGKITLNYTAPSTSESLYAVFLNGVSSVVVPLEATKTAVTIPSDLRGYAYLSVSTDSTGLDSSKTVAGPALLDLAFDSNDHPFVIQT